MEYRELFRRKVLPFVRRPNRYAGSELNQLCKNSPTVRWALAFPDLYEIGMSHLGLAILYHRINREVPDAAAERVFIPEEDASTLMRREGIPLLTLESGTPLKDVDAVGISLGYEMAMPGMLELLDLGGIPIRAEARGEGDPIVIAGGPVVFNPEPVAEFFDVVAVGDGEELAVEIARELVTAKRLGEPRGRILDRLGKLGGVYLPSRYALKEYHGGFLAAGDPLNLEAPRIIQARTVPRLLPEYYPGKPILPRMEIVHDRLNLEVMRGCTRGCRFCHAGMVYRPVRERTVTEIVEQALKNAAATGYEEIGLTSLSTSDYSYLSTLILELREAFRGKGISLSFPSLRPDSFTPEMARAFPGGRKGGITFAPEAGSQRLRNIINKNSEEEDLLRAVGLAFEEGWNGVKLYFMIGLPGEKREDIDALADLAAKVARKRTRRGQKVTVSVSPFVPKTHTPFQWFGQESVESIQEKLEYLKRKFRNTGVRFTGHNPENSLYEGALARGDRRLAGVIERVWRMGGVLEAWNDRFEPERWAQAFREEGLEPAAYLAQRDPEQPLPWKHISKGISDKFQRREWERSLRGENTDECRLGKCTGCGLTSFIPKGDTVCNRMVSVQPVGSVTQTTEEKVDQVCTARVRYGRGEEMRWTGHLDMVRLWDRMLRRAEVPVAFSQGFHPHPKLSFGPPLPVGMLSEDEYIDIGLTRMVKADKLANMLRSKVIPGLEIRETVVTDTPEETLSAKVERVDYSVNINHDPQVLKRIETWMRLDRFPVLRIRKGKRREVDIRQFVADVKPGSGDNLLVSLTVINGATVRFEELAEAWGGPDDLPCRSVRQAVYIRHDGRLVRPMDAVNGGRPPLDVRNR